MEGDLLLYVAGAWFVMFLAWSVVAPLFDDGGDSRWVLWTLVAAMAAALAGHHLAWRGVL